MYESNPAFDGKNISETDGESHGAFLSESETIHEPQGNIRKDLVLHQLEMTLRQIDSIFLKENIFLF